MACGPSLRAGSCSPTLGPAEIPEPKLLRELPWDHQEPFPLSVLLHAAQSTPCAEVEATWQQLLDGPPPENPGWGAKMPCWARPPRRVLPAAGSSTAWDTRPSHGGRPTISGSHQVRPTLRLAPDKHRLPLQQRRAGCAAVRRSSPAGCERRSPTGPRLSVVLRSPGARAEAPPAPHPG